MTKIQKDKKDKVYFKKNLKILVGVLLIILLITLASFLLLKYITPKTSVQNGVWATINGNIEVQDKSDAPIYVIVYYDSILYNNNSRLNQNAREIKAVTANKNDNKIEYSISFWLPTEMNVIITADSEGCEHKPLFIKRENSKLTIDLMINETRCYHQLSYPKDFKILARSIRASLTSLSGELSNINSLNETTLIKEEISKAWNDLQDAESSDNETQYNIPF